MANQVAARLGGDDYQHLWSWFYLLELLLPRSDVQRVTVEDPDAGFVDDVTLLRGGDAAEPDLFIQIKYHVDQRDEYSTDLLLSAKGKGTSLLQKFHATWRSLRRDQRFVEIHLLSNWGWASSDPLRKCISGDTTGITDKFFEAPPGAKVGQTRERWQEHLRIEEDEFRSFIRSLRLKVGFDCAQDLEQRVSERMEFLGLRHDLEALLVAVGLVRQMIKARRGGLSRPKFEELLAEHALYLPASDESATTVHLQTVKQQQFDVQPDYVLDWRRYFENDGQKRGHRVADPVAWNQEMLSELVALERSLAEAAAPRLIRARGRARLSAWFAFGQVFSDVAGYTLEVEQQGKFWRTDAAASDLVLAETATEQLGLGEAGSIAVGISVSGCLEEDVRADLAATHAASAVAFLRPERPLGRDCFVSAEDAVAFARQAKGLLRSLVKKHSAKKLLLFYFGPLSGACFLGHQLNAVAREIQIMEDQQPGYAPSFLLR